MASPTSPPSSPDPDSIAERLKQQFGDDIGPTLPLDPEPAADKDAPSTLFEKLRGAGTRGSRYRLLGEVARGGMGVILKIWDDELRRTLAMKVVLGRGDESKGDTPHVDPKTLGRFLEEAQVTGQLDHPGIVPVHELGLGADGRVYFTMRLVKGEELRSIFEKVRTGEDGWNQVRALGVILKVCEAMSYAHSKKVVHRDLKPANVMVGKFGEVYVMDWGLARVLGREDKHDLRIQPQPTTATVVKTERREKREETPDSPLVTMDGDVVGTPSYMPPEQAKGQLDKLGPHSDVYALGAMLYQLLTGAMPYMPRDGLISQRTILARLLDGPPETIESLAPGISAEIVAICEMAMAREVSARYSDTQAFASDLRAYLEGRVVRAYETGTWAETRKWVRRNKPLAASLAAAVFAIAIGGGAFAIKAQEATKLGQYYAQKSVDLNAANIELVKANATIETKRNEIQEKNRELELKNATLAEERSQLTDMERHADQLAHEAEERAQEADRLKNEALAQARELRVRGLIQDLAQFETLDDSLDFARSQKPPACEWWLAAAHRLVDGVQDDAWGAARWSPGLADAEALLAKLRARALPDAEENKLEDQGKLIARLTVPPIAPETKGQLPSPRTWRFAESDDQWWHTQLTRLVDELHRLRDRIAVAESSVKAQEAVAKWNEAIAAIAASSKYGALQITPQIGLLPIGTDPESGLWEFAHLPSGAPAQRGSDGKLIFEPEMGLVFVLLPGGRVPVEVVEQGQDVVQDADLTKIDLDPFFLSKYELTNVQWDRLAGWRGFGNLSRDPLLPVTGISWDDCVAQLSRSVAWLCLPTEAQWEYGCRAGTTTPWWTGTDEAGVRGAANIPARTVSPRRRVGTLRANPFGLHDVHGNVDEWCRDAFESEGSSRQLGDGFSGAPNAPTRVYRGGSSDSVPECSRSSWRGEFAPGVRSEYCGLRPARGLTP